MHENRHFLSYRKRRHDAENHVHICALRRSGESALLALVSGYQCFSQFLVSCCALAARQLQPWRFELEFCPSRLPCGQPHQFRFEANPIWYSAIKFTKSHSAKCSLYEMGMTEAQHKSQLVRGTRGNSCIVMLWVACELLQFAATQ